MKKALAVLSTIMVAGVCVACGSGNKAPKDWYNDAIDYFQKGIDDGWGSADPDDYHVKETVRVTSYVVGADGTKRAADSETTGVDEYRDSSNRFGYLLKDLDGDGTQELLVGLIDDSAQTKFLDLCVWHSDFGATHIMSYGDGDYMYLCSNGTLIIENSFPGMPEQEYRIYHSTDNAFEIVQSDGSLTAGKYELTPFD